MLEPERLVSVGKNEGRLDGILDLSAIQRCLDKLVKVAVANRSDAGAEPLDEVNPDLAASWLVQVKIWKDEVDSRFESAVDRRASVGRQEHQSSVVLQPAEKDCNTI